MVPVVHGSEAESERARLDDEPNQNQIERVFRCFLRLYRLFVVCWCWMVNREVSAGGRGMGRRTESDVGERGQYKVGSRGEVGFAHGPLLPFAGFALSQKLKLAEN
jgi:hypothetical protein